MGQLYRHGGPHKSQVRDGETRKIMLATPTAMDVTAGYAQALFGSVWSLAREGIPAHLYIVSGQCHVDDGRNLIVRDFLRSDCTDLVFLDSDVRWGPESLIRLVTVDRDVVAGIYRHKHDEMTFPVNLGDPPYQADEDGLLEVSRVPTGFLRIRRHVLEKLASKAVHYKGFHDKPDTPATPRIFERSVVDGQRCSGDYTFCNKWRAEGGRIYIDPEMHFGHLGQKEWEGSLAAHLRKINDLTLPQVLRAIETRAQNSEHVRELYFAWDNPFAASPELLEALIELVSDTEGPILEFGSGLSSLVLAAATHGTGRKVFIVEHDPKYRNQTAEWLERMQYDHAFMVDASLAGENGWQWYRVESLPENCGIVLVDGPPRVDAGEGRKGCLTIPRDVYAPGCALVLDDANHMGMGETLDALVQKYGLEFKKFGRDREFAVARFGTGAIAHPGVPTALVPRMDGEGAL